MELSLCNTFVMICEKAVKMRHDRSTTCVKLQACQKYARTIDFKPGSNSVEIVYAGRWTVPKWVLTEEQAGIII